MAKNPLHEAEALFRKRRWSQLISLLEPLSAVFRDNARFSVLLGSAYMYKEDIGGAYSCFRRAESLDYRNVEAALGLAAVHIRRGETDKAVHLYVGILERSPRARKARLGLAYLRRHTGDGQLPAGQLRRLYPEPAFRWRPLVFALLVAALACAVVMAFPSVLTKFRESIPRRDGVSDIVLSPEETVAPVGSEGGFDIILTEKDALATFDKAKRLFSDFRDEAALVELNRLLLSNATRQVKAKAESLARYVREPSFLSMPDRFSFAEVAAFPRLYEGVGIIWKGLPANMTSTATASGAATSFELLVGYHDKKRLEGIVKVVAGFELRLTPDRPVEVLARVRNSAGAAFFLECVAVHEQ